MTHYFYCLVLLIGFQVNAQITVSIISPPSGAAFAAGSDITIQATVEGSTTGGIARVEFHEGTNKLGEDTTSPYGFEWINVPGGKYTLTAVAFDNGGASTTSSEVKISVTITTGSSNQLPLVSIISPAVGVDFSVGDQITLEIDATDLDGTIEKVEIFDGPEILAILTEPPYVFVWEGATVGRHQLTAIAIDNEGGQTLSEIRSIRLWESLRPALISMYPNPIGSQGKVVFRSDGNQLYLALYNPLGQRIKTLINDVVPGGQFELDLTVSQLNDGIYYLKLSQSSFLGTKKIVVSKGTE